MSQGSKCNRSPPLWCHHGSRAEILPEPPLLVSDLPTPCRGSIHRPFGPAHPSWGSESSSHLSGFLTALGETWPPPWFLPPSHLGP